MPTRYVYVPRSYRGGAMTTPRHFADLNPVSLSYSPLVPPVAEATQVPIPVTEQAAEEIESTNPLGKIVSIATNYAKSATSNPDFNALMGVLAQYLISTAGQKLSTPPPPPKPKSWFERVRDYWTLTPAEKRQQEQKTAFSRGQYLTAAAPLIGKVASAFVPGTGDMVTNGLLSLGQRFGWGRRGGRLRKRRRPGKPIFKENKITGETTKIGTTANLEKDVKAVAKEAFAEKLEKDHGRDKTKEFVDEVFDSPGWISKIADIFAYVVSMFKPDWYIAAQSARSLVKAGDSVYKDYKTARKEQDRRNLEDFKNTVKNNLKGSGMRGGRRRRSTLNGFSSQKEKMAWVRSFRSRKKGSGYRKKHSKRRKRGGGKGSIYKYYASSNPFRFKSKSHKRRGRGLRGGDLVDSGWLGIGDPNNPSGYFSPYRYH